MSMIATGQVFPVPHFMKIKNPIGLTRYAQHGMMVHGQKLTLEYCKKYVGNADTDYYVRVLRKKNGVATVVLLRKTMPGGAKAPHGVVFTVPVEQLLRWPEERLQEEHRRSEGLKLLNRAVTVLLNSAQPFPKQAMLSGMEDSTNNDLPTVEKVGEKIAGVLGELPKNVGDLMEKLARTCSPNEEKKELFSDPEGEDVHNKPGRKLREELLSVGFSDGIEVDNK